MEKIIKLVEKPYLKAEGDALKVSVGDTVKTHLKVVEGDKVRIQIFAGIVISIRGEGQGKTIKIRKISYGVGVEKTFLINSPIISKIEIINRGIPKRAKLFYLRDRVGKRALKVRTLNIKENQKKNTNSSKVKKKNQIQIKKK